MLSLCVGSKVCDEETHFETILNDISGKKPPVDKKKLLYGFKYIGTIFGSIKTTSWPFPAFVNNIFIVLAPLFIMTAFYFLLINWQWTTNCYLSTVAILIVSSCHVFIWIILAGKLFTLLEGSNTVDNFCWKFLPFRIMYLNESRNIKPEYFFKWCPITKKQKKNRKV